ncbi:MAG: imidazoleglycerol-phosphate dehydratase HisB [Verrucomicrobiales bacterium]
MRKAHITRNTAETKIKLELNLDGEGSGKISTGIGFFDHMLTLWTHHGKFDLTVEAQGDLHVDSHHTVEDVGIALGQAFSEALGDKAGIARYAQVYLPMDEALARLVVDISGRPYLATDLPEQNLDAAPNFPFSLLEEFLRAFVNQARVTLHVALLSGRDRHHQFEAVFKGFGRVLDQATQVDPRLAGRVPSTKGVL